MCVLFGNDAHWILLTRSTFFGFALFLPYFPRILLTILSIYLFWTFSSFLNVWVTANERQSPQATKSKGGNKQRVKGREVIEHRKCICN